MKTMIIDDDLDENTLKQVKMQNTVRGRQKSIKQCFVLKSESASKDFRKNF